MKKDIHVPQGVPAVKRWFLVESIWPWALAALSRSWLTSRSRYTAIISFVSISWMAQAAIADTNVMLSVEEPSLPSERVPFAQACGAPAQPTAAFYFNKPSNVLLNTTRHNNAGHNTRGHHTSGDNTAGGNTSAYKINSNANGSITTGDRKNTGGNSLSFMASSRGLEWLNAVTQTRQVWLSTTMQTALSAKPLRYQILTTPQAAYSLFWQEADGTIRSAAVRENQILPRWQTKRIAATNSTGFATDSWLAGTLPLVSTNKGQAGSQLALAGVGDAAVQLVDTADGSVQPLASPATAGNPVGVVAALDSDHNGETDRLYLATDRQQIWRWQRAMSGQWQAEHVAQLPVELGSLAGNLQAWSAKWPPRRAPTPPAAETLANAATKRLAVAGATGASSLAALPLPEQQGDVLVLLTRVQQSFGLLVLKINRHQSQLLTIDAASHSSDHWFYALPGRPVSAPVVLGSVLYVPLTTERDCEFPQSYQQLLALDLFDGQPLYTTPVLTFQQEQQSSLRVSQLNNDYALGTDDEQIIPQLKVLDPDCDYCHRRLTAGMLQQQRWVAGYLAERAY